MQLPPQNGQVNGFFYNTLATWIWFSSFIGTDFVGSDPIRWRFGTTLSSRRGGWYGSFFYHFCDAMIIHTSLHAGLVRYLWLTKVLNTPVCISVGEGWQWKSIIRPYTQAQRMGYSFEASNLSSEEEAWKCYLAHRVSRNKEPMAPCRLGRNNIWSDPYIQ